MIVRFDSLNRYEVPNFTVCNPGSVYKNGVLTKVVGSIACTSDEEIVYNFNATSSLSFRAYKIPSDGSPEGDYALKVYNSLKNRRLVFVEDTGYFIITDTNDGTENGVTYKDITASSCEIEIQNKGIIYIEDGTYKFTDLMEMMVSALPKWTVDHIDEAVAERYRTFEDVDSTLNMLAFMMENMQEAYECIFVFDIINRRINVYDQNSYIIHTDIHLTKDDLINTMGVSENVDELYTALSVFGEDNLTISSVNPLGTTTIYNFDYYLDWMSEGLRNKVISWSNLIDSYTSEYFDLNDEYYRSFTKRSNVQDEIARLQSQLDIYTQCRDNIVAESSTDKVDEYNDALASNNGTEITITDSIDEMLVEIDLLISKTNLAIDEQEDDLEKLESEMDAVDERIVAIQDEVSIQTYFTQDEYDELYDYIFEGTYTDEYVITTDIMSMSEKLAQMQELYNRAKKSLNSASSPTQEFTVDTEDFIFVKKFQKWSEQLETGCLINVEIDEGDVAELFLITLSLNWHDKVLSMTFGNRFNKADPQSLFNNVLGDIQKSSNTISYIKEILSPVKGGKLDELQESINDSKTLTVSDAISSHDGEVSIGSTGYTGKKKLSSGGFRPEQLKIISNRIVYTEDAWKTCEMVLGYVALANSDIKYGVNAGTVIGDLTLCESLRIVDEYGNTLFEVVDTKVSDAVSKYTESFNKSIKNLADKDAEIDKSIDEIGTDIDSLFGETKELRDKLGLIPDGDSVYALISNLQSEDVKINESIAAVQSDIVKIKEQLGI